MSRSRMGIRKGPHLTHGEVLLIHPHEGGICSFGPCVIHTIPHRFPFVNTRRIIIHNVAHCNCSTFAALVAFHRQTRKRARALRERACSLSQRLCNPCAFRWLVVPFGAVATWVPSAPVATGATPLGARRNGRNPFPRGGPSVPNGKTPRGFPVRSPRGEHLREVCHHPQKEGRRSRRADRGKRELSVDAERLHRNKREKARAPFGRSCNPCLFPFRCGKGDKGNCRAARCGARAGNGKAVSTHRNAVPVFSKRGFPSPAALWRGVEKRARHSFAFSEQQQSVVAEKISKNKMPPKKGACVFAHAHDLVVVAVFDTGRQ